MERSKLWTMFPSRQPWGASRWPPATWESISGVTENRETESEVTLHFYVMLPVKLGRGVEISGSVGVSRPAAVLTQLKTGRTLQYGSRSWRSRDYRTGVG